MTYAMDFCMKCWIGITFTHFSTSGKPSGSGGIFDRARFGKKCQIPAVAGAVLWYSPIIS